MLRLEASLKAFHSQLSTSIKPLPINQASGLLVLQKQLSVTDPKSLTQESKKLSEDLNKHLASIFALIQQDRPLTTGEKEQIQQFEALISSPLMCIQGEFSCIARESLMNLRALQKSMQTLNIPTTLDKKFDQLLQANCTNPAILAATLTSIQKSTIEQNTAVPDERSVFTDLEVDDYVGLIHLFKTMNIRNDHTPLTITLRTTQNAALAKSLAAIADWYGVKCTFINGNTNLQTDEGHREDYYARMASYGTGNQTVQQGPELLSLDHQAEHYKALLIHQKKIDIMMMSKPDDLVVLLGLIEQKLLDANEDPNLLGHIAIRSSATLTPKFSRDKNKPLVLEHLEAAFNAKDDQTDLLSDQAISLLKFCQQYRIHFHCVSGAAKSNPPVRLLSAEKNVATGRGAGGVQGFSEALAEDLPTSKLLSESFKHWNLLTAESWVIQQGFYLLVSNNHQKGEHFGRRMDQFIHDMQQYFHENKEGFTDWPAFRSTLQSLSAKNDLDKNLKPWLTQLDSFASKVLVEDKDEDKNNHLAQKQRDLLVATAMYPVTDEEKKVLNYDQWSYAQSLFKMDHQQLSKENKDIKQNFITTDTGQSVYAPGRKPNAVMQYLCDTNQHTTADVQLVISDTDRDNTRYFPITLNDTDQPSKKLSYQLDPNSTLWISVASSYVIDADMVKKA